MATIKAGCRHNRTCFRLQSGKTYRFSASGTWRDWGHETSATGYTDDKLRRWEKWRRAPDAKWFSVIGRIDRRKQSQFDLGRLIETGAPYTATATGVLYCFANDVWFMYWNNKGAIELQMEEVP